MLGSLNLDKHSEHLFSFIYFIDVYITILQGQFYIKIDFFLNIAIVFDVNILAADLAIWR